MFAFGLLTHHLGFRDAQTFVHDKLFLGRLGLVEGLVCQSEKFGGRGVAAEEGWVLFSGLVQPLDVCHGLADVLAGHHVKGLRKGLKFSDVAVVVKVVVVAVLVDFEANDAATAITHAENLTAFVEGDGREHVVLCNLCRVRLAELSKSSHF